MRVVFVHKMVHQDPLGVMYLSAALKQAGHETHFVDVGLDREWEERVVELRPDIVAYSIITGSHEEALEVNRRLKRRFDFISLWGGPHPTFFPEIIDDPHVDVLCIGEGEEAVVELADALEQGAPIESIANLHVKNEDGTIRRNEPRPLRQNLDELPFPDREILDRYPQYRYVTSRAVIASRGCPYSCTFCFNSRLRGLYRGKGKYARRRSVDNIIAECRRYRDDPWVKQILFKDDLFAHKADFVAELAERFPVEIGLPFTCNVRADRVTEEIADNLARAGASVVHFGVESGNDRIRREVLKRPITRQEMIDTARWFRERGVKVYTFNLLGIPGEEPEDALETLALNIEIEPDIAMFTIFQPYPNTPLGDRAVELGLVEAGSSDFSRSFYQNSMTNLPHARQFRNMVHLFPVATRWPALRRAMPVLSRLPITPAFAAADFVYKSTKFIFDLRIVQPRDIALYSGHWVPKHHPSD